MGRFAEAVEQALARSHLAAIELARRRGEPPSPGDLFVARATRDFPVEWLVVERDRRSPERLRVLLADASPILGSADFAVPAAAGSGRLSLRCRYGAWIAAGDLDPGLRSGAVGADVVAQALHRCRELAQGPVNLPGAEDESEQEYRDWVDDVVAPAHAALTAASAEPAATGTGAGRVGTMVRRLPPVRSRLYPLAVAALLLIALGAGAALLWQRLEVGRLAQESELLRRALRHEQAGTRAAVGQVERYRRELDQAATARRSDHERIAALERAADGSRRYGEPLANLPFVLLQPRETVRGKPMTIPRPARSPYLLLLLELATEPAPPYRLEITRRGQSGAVWTIGSLEKTGPSELTVAVPSRWLDAGEYELRLYASSATAPFREYALAVRPD